jgi:Hint module
MRELRVGDSVRSSATAFTKVLLFTHADDAIETEFVNIHWDLESSPISLSPNHYIHCNGKLVVASAVQVGDTIISGVDGGRSLTVTGVDRKRMVGLYNPQTASGNIVVNGIVASTFTTAVPIKLAQVLLTPLKIASETFSIDIPGLSRFFRFGAPWAAALLPYGPASYEL